MKQKRLFSSRASRSGLCRLALLAAAVLALPAAYAQQDHRLKVNESLPASNAIIRDYGAQKLIYVEDVEIGGDGYHIDSYNNKFVLTGANGAADQVASVSTRFNGVGWKINDVKILGDTAYFCGYMEPSVNYFIGFIGFFHVSRLFAGRDSVHLLQFNQTWLQNRGEGSYMGCRTYLKINYPTKLEPLRVPDGVHLLCVGKCSVDTTSSLRAINNTFVADIVHDRRANSWWYYAHLSDIEQFADAAITDNFAATVGVKENHATYYLRMYEQPHSVSYNANYKQDDSFFATRGRLHPIHSYYCFWTSRFDLPNINSPLLAHTEADSIAIAYLTYTSRHLSAGVAYGATVKHFSLSNMFAQIEDHAGPVFGSSLGMREMIQLAADADVRPDENATIAPMEIPSPHRPDWQTNDSLRSEGTPNIDVPIYYNRMIEQSTFPSVGNSWPIKEITYERNAKRLFLLQRESYRFYPLSYNFSIFAFNIHNTLAPVEIMRPDPDHYYRSIHASSNPYAISIAGFTPHLTNTNRLLYGEMPYNNSNCLADHFDKPSFDPQGQLVGRVLSGFAWDFDYFRVDPVTVDTRLPAFAPCTIEMIIKYSMPDIVCE